MIKGHHWPVNLPMFTALLLSNQTDRMDDDYYYLLPDSSSFDHHINRYNG